MLIKGSRNASLSSPFFIFLIKKGFFSGLPKKEATEKANPEGVTGLQKITIIKTKTPKGCYKNKQSIIPLRG